MEIADEFLENLENQEIPAKRELRRTVHRPLEFKVKAVEIYTETASLSETARILNVPVSTIHGWIRSPDNRELVDAVARQHAQLRIAQYDELAQLAVVILKTDFEQGKVRGKEAAVILGILEDKREMLLKQQAVLGLPQLTDPTSAYFQALDQEHAVAQELKRRAAMRAQAKEGEILTEAVTEASATDQLGQGPAVPEAAIIPPDFGEELSSESALAKQSSTEEESK